MPRRQPTHRPALRLAALPCLLALAACGGGAAFRTTFPDDRTEPIAQVERRLREAPSIAARGIAVGAVADEQAVFAYDLDARRMLWKVQGAPSSPPLIAGNVVVVHETGQVRVLALSDGHELLRRDDAYMSLMGAAGEGDLTAVVMSSGGSVGARSRLFILRSGQLESELDVRYALGAPAVAGGLVFVPWNNVFLSVLSPEGREVARVRIREEVVSRAFAQDGAVYFGQLGLFRFDESLLAGEKARDVYFRPTRQDLPGQPAFLQAANVPPPPVQSALHRVTLNFRAAETSEGLGLEGGHYFLTFYQQVFALSPTETTADWAFSHDLDLVGAKACRDGLWLADESGKLLWLDEQGQPRFETSLGVMPSVTNFRCGDSPPPLSPAAPPASLADQLAAAAMHPDARLVPSRAMAVRMLAPIEGNAASSHLLELCRDPDQPLRVHEAACTSLGQRSSGPAPILEGLEQRPDFLARVPAPPLGALSAAAAHMELREAVPQLLSHMQDPATPADALPAIIKAVDALGDRESLAPARDFLMLYHAHAEDQALDLALQRVMDALRHHMKADAGPTLEIIAHDPMGLAPLRGYASQLLAEMAEQTEPAAEKPATGAADAAATPNDEAELPEQLDASHVERALDPVMSELHQCVRQDSHRPGAVRLTIVVDGEGEVLLVRTLPESAQACMEPLVRSATFPGNHHMRRQQLLYSVGR